MLANVSEAFRVASEAATAAFYAAGTLALIIGAAIAWRRYQVQSPQTAAWLVEVREVELRRVGEAADATWSYSSSMSVTNESQSRQRLDRVWLRMRLAREPGFTDDLPKDPLNAPGFFDRVSDFGADLKPGGKADFGQTHGNPRLRHSVGIW